MTAKKPSDVQIGGGHYKDMPIQPYEFCYRNKLDNLQSNVIKYTVRHKFKSGAEDIKKAIHTLQVILEYEYDEEPKDTGVTNETQSLRDTIMTVLEGLSHRYSKNVPAVTLCEGVFFKLKDVSKMRIQLEMQRLLEEEKILLNEDWTLRLPK